MSIPKLELCGAVLLAELLQKIKSGLHLESVKTYGWTDSNVVLAWISNHASKWTPFVANRVSKIQSILTAQNWFYVSSGHNPANVATRGITPLQLKNCQQWWHGPYWLEKDIIKYTSSVPLSTIPPERKNNTTILTAQVSDNNNILTRFSSYSKLIRVVAYINRFTNNCKRSTDKQSSFITSEELLRAKNTIIKISQRTSFNAEVADLNNKKCIKNASKLLPFKPFLDSMGILRVGGRIENAPMLTFSNKHPILLDKFCPLSTLLINYAHSQTLHGGPSQTRNFVSSQFWIVNGRSLYNKVVRSCVRCARYTNQPIQAQMADLPSCRVTGIKPFLTTGVDYAGPIRITPIRRRGLKPQKAYMCLFVCTAVKAVHLELVSDMTSTAFIAAFNDNGTNFHGADRQLQQMYSEASSFYHNTAQTLANVGVEWSFIPPSAPHFGGLWEAGVRSVKSHLRRVIGDTVLTFEELSTLLCKIEACLNSRPLTELSYNPKDKLPLTPGHFLVGEPTTSIPEPNLINEKISPANRWDIISKLRDIFWERWRKEYLQTLQKRVKWLRPQPNVLKDSIVLLSEEKVPPSQWPLGRVIETIKGKDNIVRVVKIKIGSKILTRPVVKLCLMPIPTPRASPDQ
ncbi:hypothetical protein TKK_0012979 [Trichogramma kaykai]